MTPRVQALRTCMKNNTRLSGIVTRVGPGVTIVQVSSLSGLLIRQYRGGKLGILTLTLNASSMRRSSQGTVRLKISILTASEPRLFMGGCEPRRA